jgi:hypothetical protein
VNPVQFPADEEPEGTVFIHIRVPASQFLYRTVTPDGCQSGGGMLPRFGQFFLIPEAVDKDTHCPAASQVLQPHNRTAPDLRVRVLATVNQQPCCRLVSAASQFLYAPHPLFRTPFSQYFFNEVTGPVRFLAATEPFIGHPDGIHSHNSPEMTRTGIPGFFAGIFCLVDVCFFYERESYKLLSVNQILKQILKHTPGSVCFVPEARIRRFFLTVNGFLKIPVFWHYPALPTIPRYIFNKNHPVA